MLHVVNRTHFTILIHIFESMIIKDDLEPGIVTDTLAQLYSLHIVVSGDLTSRVTAPKATISCRTGRISDK